MVKLQELGEKLKLTCQERDALALVQREEARKQQELQAQIRDTAFYTQAMEKENVFLRQEIERVKYSKDKDSYGRFMAGLMKNKAIKGLNGCPEEQPLREITNAATEKKRVEFSEEPLPKSDKKPAKVQEEVRKPVEQPAKKEPVVVLVAAKENQENQSGYVPRYEQEAEKEQRKAEYNQRLLKSLERKSLRDSVASL